MKNKILIYIALIPFIIGCNNGNKETIFEKKQGQITIIFKDFPKENSTLRITKQRFINASFDISYTEDNLYQQRIFFDNSKQSDTVRISTQRNSIEVILTFKGIESSNYIFNKNDTIVFHYDSGIPIATIANRKTLNSDINYNVQCRFVISNGDIPAIRKYSAPSFFIKSDYNDKIKLNSYKDSCAKVIEAQCIKELIFLDSIYANGNISNDIYLLKKKNLLWSVWLMKKNKVSYDDLSLRKLLSDTIIFLNSNDTLLYYNYYRAYLNKNIMIRLKKIPFIRESNSNLPDYCTEFDSIAQFNFLSEKALKYFLIEKLGNILDNCSASEIEKYQARFLTITKDSLVLKKLLSHYKIDLSTKCELLLDDLSGKRMIFESLQKTYQGKVIYLDFWASWCAPCRASMPYTKKLRGEYKGKPVVFIYLAFKDQEKAWKEAISKLGLDSNCENYFITNPKTSKMIEQFKVKTIPRFMLFDKKGRMINQNAPSPEGKEIRNLIDKLLLE